MKIVIEFDDDAEQSDAEFYVDSLPELEDDHVVSIQIVDETVLYEDVK